MIEKWMRADYDNNGSRPGADLWENGGMVAMFPIRDYQRTKKMGGAWGRVNNFQLLTQGIKYNVSGIRYKAKKIARKRII